MSQQRRTQVEKADKVGAGVIGADLSTYLLLLEEAKRGKYAASRSDWARRLPPDSFNTSLWIYAVSNSLKSSWFIARNIVAKAARTTTNVRRNLLFMISVNRMFQV
jgi:hypothetical protein